MFMAVLLGQNRTDMQQSHCMDDEGSVLHGPPCVYNETTNGSFGTAY